ncbi:Ig-like domain-containing protein [Actinoallomurus bryophytorum]|uniref:Lipoprotein-anchoring transpeptidase ErfK/SrfK n=1 Tax=Actinoallomurus bryophytorum TaxID=1490222 RepID=A0A543CVF0_9ACTN|nr:Ig-like domain-containing protein [Actinoallomurus bryophytorum]TQM01085.1 lipoprotein-anchoring transpeptidase ErfK/SrfK [Actinoallomurus bryophytorum]
MPIAACSSDGSAASQSAAKAPDAAATITPANGVKKVRPDKGVQVAAANGVLDQVTVQGGGRKVEGTLSPDKKSWTSKWTLKPGATYTVTATAKNAGGKITTSTSKFTTMKAPSSVKVSDVIPSARETVGIGMPITINFDSPVANKSAVEKALEVRSTKPVEGAWRWITSQQVIFRTKSYWPAHTSVSLVAHMSGVRAAAKVYGTKDFTRTFKIGASHVAKVSLKTDKSKVYVDGKLAKTISVSGGMGGADSHGNDFRTTSGVHLAMGKMPEVWMTSPNIKKNEPGYYHELVLNDVQISNSGEYLHRSPGEWDCLGNRNCSHGCVRQTVAGALWFYKLSQRGDVINITGTTRKLEWNNGWGYYQMPWKTWVKGGALKKPVTTVATGGATTTPTTPTAPSGSPTPAHS